MLRHAKADSKRTAASSNGKIKFVGRQGKAGGAKFSMRGVDMIICHFLLLRLFMNDCVSDVLPTAKTTHLAAFW